MRATTIRRWSFIHKWTSLICTLFLLMLCLTGLPLVFKDEIDGLLYSAEPPAAHLPGANPENLDRIVSNAIEKFPGHVVQFLVWDRDEPGLMLVAINTSPDASTSTSKTLRIDEYTGRLLGESNVTGRLTHFLLILHSEMFAGTPGKLFLGLIGLLFIVATVSGVVLYGPSMRRHAFGTFRQDRSRLILWLDFHNLVGISTVMWILVVGVTGAINTASDIVLKGWQSGQLAEMANKYGAATRPSRLASVQAALDTAMKAAPHMTPLLIAFPGSAFSSNGHYAVFVHGDTPLTTRLLKPVLIDAGDGSLTDSRDMPWYVSALLLSQPLHFGDYGGLPLKIIWAIFDILTIGILGSGVYLWLARAVRTPQQSGQSSTSRVSGIR